MNPIPRVVEEDPANEIAKMWNAILSMPRPKTQAVTVFPGQGETWRLEHAVKIWKEWRSHYLLVAGVEWKTEATSQRPTGQMLTEHPYELSEYDLDRVEIQEHARHTPDQTSWVAQMVKKWDITSISLVVSPYHLPRAYLTLVKEFIKLRAQIPIIPIPVPMSPYRIIPEQQANSWTMMDGEIERIKKYQCEPYQSVATFNEFKQYMDWLWKQPLLQE